MNKYWTYPDDAEIRTWLTLVWPVTEATWKHLEEYADPGANPVEKRRYEACARGIQQAGAGLEVARLLDEKKNGAVNGSGMRELVETLLRSADAWYNAPREKILEPS